MDIADVFYFTGTVFFILLSIGIILIVSQIIMIRQTVERNLKGIGKAFALASTARFSIQAVLLKSLISLLGGGDDNERRK